MSYHPLAPLRSPALAFRGLGGEVSASLPPPNQLVAASRYAGGFLETYNGKELLQSLVTAYRTPGQSDDIASVISKEVVNRGATAGCAAAGAAATAMFAPVGILVGPACKAIAGKVNAEMNRPRPMRQYIDPGPFHAELVGKAQASCAPGDNDCKAKVAAEVAKFTTGEISPLRIWNLWAGDNCMSCSSNWLGQKSCKLADDPACQYDEGLVWDDAMAGMSQKIATLATASRLKAEGDFARSVVAQAQEVKPSLMPLCAGDGNCESVVDTSVDLAAMRTALAMRLQDEKQAVAQWSTELADIENKARDTAVQNAKIVALEAQGRMAEAARVKAELSAKNKARVAAQNAKAQAYLQDVFAGQAAEEKAAKRKKAVGLAVLATAIGAAYLWTKRRTGR